MGCSGQRATFSEGPLPAGMMWMGSGWQAFFSFQRCDSCAPAAAALCSFSSHWPFTSESRFDLGDVQAACGVSAIFVDVAVAQPPSCMGGRSIGTRTTLLDDMAA